ncbi:hypothetical protein [Rhodoferax sp.]|uniref:hypothetical protein n=1 Tax=Rhodoferax sp. TaxID=50421 RepID=UPI002631E06D|nr:hypothetical protein [Rhodoferax sp.]MDD2924560.1 hypothetical protein [Rhodoferax sp.]
MTNVLLKLLGWVVRLGLLLAGAVFFVSLLAAGLLVLAVWLLRALWAKLTGQPVSPWTFQMKRQAAWQRFYPHGPAQPGNATPGKVVDAEVTDITDVEPKRIERFDR